MKKVMLCLLPAAAIAPWACNTVNTVEPAVSQSVPHYIEDKRVETDLGLKHIAQVVAVNTTCTESGLLKVEVQLCNRKPAAVQFNYCFEWFDEGGMLIRTPPPVWVTSYMEGRETKHISATAQSLKARDFRLKLLEDVREH